MSRPHLCHSVLWHEVAHHVQFAFNRANSPWRIREQTQIKFDKGHGAVFAQAFARVVRLQMGLEAVRALRWAFRSWRVRTADFEKQTVRLRAYRGPVQEEWLRFGRDVAMARVAEINEARALREQRELWRPMLHIPCTDPVEEAERQRMIALSERDMEAERKRLAAQNERVMAMVERSKRAAADGTA